MDKAKGVGSPTPRERALIDALAILYSSADAGDAARAHDRLRGGDESRVRREPERQRSQDFLRPRRWRSRRRRPTRPTRRTCRRPASSSRSSSRCPTHPGLAHYIIHAYDAPPLADKALVAARRYASLAPAIPHALHMPSHTFTRVGSWKESIETNKRSADRSEEDWRRRRRAARASTTRPTRFCRPRRTKRRRRWSMKRRRLPMRRPPLLPRRRPRRRRAARTRSPLPPFPRAMRSSAETGPKAAALKPRPRQHAVHRSDDALCARDRRGAQRQPCRGDRRYREDCGAAAARSRAQGRVLGRAARHPAPRRAGVADLCDGQERRRHRRNSKPPPMPKTRPTSRR